MLVYSVTTPLSLPSRRGKRSGGEGVCYTMPCAIMALATFMNPATLAPFT